jgi:hypothetical protein
MALLILREDMINDATWLRLTNMRRALFKRAMREGEDTKALKEALNQEDLMEKKIRNHLGLTRPVHDESGTGSEQRGLSSFGL